jgi:hypothetical protein
MVSFQMLGSLHRMGAEPAEPAKSAEFPRGIREIIRTIGKTRISGSAFIASGEGTPLRTAEAISAAIFPRLPILQQMHQLKHRLRRLSPL